MTLMPHETDSNKKPLDSQQAWYLVYTKPRQERTAQFNLVRQGYEAYLPLFKGRRRQQGRKVSAVEPMFPRYLFLSLNNR